MAIGSEERQGISDIALLIQSTGRKLNFTAITITNALMIYHVFQKTGKAGPLDNCTLAAAILILSAEQCEEDLKLGEIFNIFYRLKMNLPNPEVEVNLSQDTQKKMKESLNEIKEYITLALDFKLDYDSPFKYIGHYLLQLKNLRNPLDHLSYIGSLATKVVSSFYLSTFSTRYEANEIAVAAFKMALMLDAKDVSNYPALHLEYQSFAHIPEDKMQEIIKVLCSVTVVADSLPESPM